MRPSTGKTTKIESHNRIIVNWYDSHCMSHRLGDDVGRWLFALNHSFCIGKKECHWYSIADANWYDTVFYRKWLEFILYLPYLLVLDVFSTRVRTRLYQWWQREYFPIEYSTVKSKVDVKMKEHKLWISTSFVNSSSALSLSLHKMCIIGSQAHQLNTNAWCLLKTLEIGVMFSRTHSHHNMMKILRIRIHVTPYVQCTCRWYAQKYSDA